MEAINRIKVSLLFDNKPQKVGDLIADAGKIYFKYDLDFLASALEISPFKLPLKEEIVSASPIPFDGLFGVFNDSLPDGWGRLLLDRTLSFRNHSLQQISPLDRLAFIGKKGMGALVYEPEIENENHFYNTLELDYIASEMEHILEGAPSDIIEELFAFGGSSGGARPKLTIGYNPITEQLIHGTPTLPDGYEHWIIKFPASQDFVDAAQVEYAYYLMALSAGIEMTTCKLFQGKSGKFYFGTKRFDRLGDQRLHLQSASGLLHDDFRMSTMDYGHLMDAGFQLEKHVQAYEKVLRLAAFNLYSHNRDDHSKNFSFLMNSAGKWDFAPAYDLTFSCSSRGWHSTSFAGEYQNPTQAHLLELAAIFGLKNPMEIITKVQEVVANWKQYAKNSNVSSYTSTTIEKTTQGLLRF
jgi:serine/threonine-protein kinase HipA